MPVRPLAEADIPEVADLYWKVLREKKGLPPQAIQSFLHELYFTNPWRADSFPSLVYDEKGKVAGFLGVVPRKMRLNGEAVQIAYGGNFVVHPEYRTTLAGLHLLRTYMAGKQDLSLTDSANDTSRALLERLGFTTILPLSVHWVRLLRPMRSFTYGMSKLAENPLARCLDLVARPFCAAADKLATALPSSPFRHVPPKLQVSDLDMGTLISCAGELRNGYTLFPDYDAASLTWLFAFMERRKGHGERLRKRLLRDDTGKVAGWFIYYITGGGFAEVAQIGGTRRQMKDILDHLFYEAWTLGAIAVHGTIDRSLMDVFSEKNCFFTCRGGWTLAHSRKPTLLEVLSSGNAFFSRLDGEWCLQLGV